MNREDAMFPFTAVVGQEQAKEALLLNAVSHRVGGVLIRGVRGTAKSTLARGLAQLLPEIEAVDGCPFSCDPHDIESLCPYCANALTLQGELPVRRVRMDVVTLPLNATEEMVSGTLDLEKALREGERCFEPGILARANRSVLYVDEVNLLEDHLVDILLDSAAMGVNVVEREGVSFRHQARFILVGTMNPEEGDLRPQLEDRFGLCAEAESCVSPGNRSEILRRNLQFSRSALEFESRWHAEQEELRRKLVSARTRYDELEVPDELLDTVARIVNEARVDGHRADMSMMHAARALAALEGSHAVLERHLLRVAPLALNHRTPRDARTLDSPHRVDLQAILRKVGGGEDGEEPGTDESAGARCDVPGGQDPPGSEPSTGDGLKGRGEGLRLPREENRSASNGRGSTTRETRGKGRYYRSSTPEPGRRLRASEVALDATIRSSAVRGGGGDGKPDISEDDLRVKVRKKRCGSSIVFVVDASASMGAKKRLEASRQAVLSLLVEAYRKRDRVGLVIFKDSSAQLVLNPTSSTVLAGRLLERVTPGGTTPLAHGLTLGYRVLERETARDPSPHPILVLITDGGGNISIASGDPVQEALDVAARVREKGMSSLVLDSGVSASRAGLPSTARRIAQEMGGDYHPVPEISCDEIVGKIKASLAELPGGLPRTTAG